MNEKQLTQKEVIAALKKSGIKIDSHTFRYYQSINLLPKPIKIADKRGQGVRGVYPPYVLKAIKSIYSQQKKGKSLAEIKDFFSNLSVVAFNAELQKWGFSDHNLYGLEGYSDQDANIIEEPAIKLEQETRLAVEKKAKELFPDATAAELKDIVDERLIKLLPGSDKAFEAELQKKKLFWYVHPIRTEIEAIEYILSRAASLSIGLSYAISVLRGDGTVPKQVVRLGIKLFELWLLRCKLFIRLNEIKETPGISLTLSVDHPKEFWEDWKKQLEKGIHELNKKDNLKNAVDLVKRQQETGMNGKQTIITALREIDAVSRIQPKDQKGLESKRRLGKVKETLQPLA